MSAKKKPKAKKTTAKKTTGQKTPKKTTMKKTTKKRAAKKKAPAKASAKKTETAKKATAKPKAAGTKKDSGKRGTKRTAAGTGTPSQRSKGGITVQIAPRRPSLAIAPGVMITNRQRQEPRPENADTEETRKLTRSELTEIKDQLLTKREQLLHGIRRELADHRARAANTPADEADKATDAYDESLSFEIATASDEELEEIEEALEKIADGTYGQCELCGCTIAPSRLKILPYATACKACRDAKERAKNRGDGIVSWGLVSDSDDEEEE